MPVDATEQHLIDQTRLLTEQGMRLQLATDLEALEHWDDQVNELLERINRSVAEGGLASQTLKHQLGRLVQLYLTVLEGIARLQREKDDESLSLRQKRWAITG